VLLPSLVHFAAPGRSRRLRCGRETCSVDVSNPHRFIFQRRAPTSRAATGACAPVVRTVHAAHIAGASPTRLRMPSSSILCATPAGASTRTFSFRAARLVPNPLTTRHPAGSRPLVSSERSLPAKPRPESHVPVKVTRWPDPGRLPSPCRLQQAIPRSRPGCDPVSVRFTTSLRPKGWATSRWFLPPG